MLRSTTLHLTALVTLLLFLSGCGGGSEAVDAAGKSPNSFSRNSTTANEEIAQNGTSDTTACTGTGPSSVTFCLVVEATDTMIASWQSDLFNLITPAKAYAFRGLTTVPAKSIEIIQVDEDLNQVSNSSVPTYTVTENPATGTYSINFSESPPARIDVIAKVTLDNGQVLLAPFIDSSIDRNYNPIVVVNVVSDFLVKRLYNNKLDTPQALDNLLPCNEGGSNYGNNVLCNNQPFAKFNLWSALNGLTQSYEIDIPADYTISQAFDLLNKTGDFTTHIDTTLDEILRTQETFVGGTERQLDLEDIQNSAGTPITKEYNSTLFSLSFSQTNPDSSLKGASISSTISSPFERDSGAIDYPKMTRNTNNFYVTITNLIEDFPILRTSLDINQASELSLSPAKNNSLTSAPSNTFLTSQGFYVVGKMPFQTITDKSDASAIGWQSDPYTQLIYSSDSNEAGPQSMFSSLVRNGGKYAITANENSTWTRNNQLEEQNIFAWNSYNLAESPTAAAFESKKYGAISFSLKLNETGNIHTTTGEILHWDKNSSSPESIEQTQPIVSLLADNHYQSYSFSRAESQDLTVSDSSIDATTTYRSYKALDSTNGPKGRISVSAPNTNELSLGSSTPAGELITVTQNDPVAGQGLITALEARTVTPTNLTGTIYRLAGNSFGANAASNVLRNYNNSTIELTSPTTAKLTFQALESTHNVSTQEVSDISAVTIQEAVGTYAVDGDGLIQFVFNDVQGAGKTLRLKGFMSKSMNEATETDAPGNVLALLMIHDYDNTNNTQATLGLVYALKELNLDVKID